MLYSKTMKLRTQAAVLMVCFLWTAFSQAATITDIIRNRYGTGVRANISFVPKGGVQFTNNATYATWTVTTNSATNGTFTVSLLAGTYQVLVGTTPEDKFYIQVPTNTGPYAFNQITTNSPTGYWTWTNIWPFVPASALVAGSVGLVPAPAAGDQAKMLRGDGTWGAGTGIGDLLAANALSDLAANTNAARTNLNAHNAASLTVGTLDNARLEAELQIFAGIVTKRLLFTNAVGTGLVYTNGVLATTNAGGGDMLKSENPDIKRLLGTEGKPLQGTCFE